MSRAAQLLLLLAAAAAAAPELEPVFVEQLIWEARAFKDAQHGYGRLHGLLDRMSSDVEGRLFAVQKDFDGQAGHVLQWEERATEKLARAELAMAELIAQVRATTVGGAASFTWAFAGLAVLLAGLGVQYFALRGAVKQAQRAGPLLGGFGSGGGGGGAKHHWV